ncbi:MAG TPA: hypothetical protein VF808_08245 [Ktedonobacterales bacterium]
MARIPPVGSGGGSPPKGGKPHHHRPRHHHRKGRHHKGRRHHPHHRKPKTLHPHGYHQSGAVPAAEAGASRDPGDDKVNPAVGGGGPGPAREIAADTLGGNVDSGLLGAVLQLAGSGDLSGSALATWQREQDRISNRQWRRPGGMQRMGGL